MVISEVCHHVNMTKKEFCLKGRIFTNELCKMNVQFREDYPRLKQTWTEKVGKGEILILLFMKPINNVNHKDWSYIRRISGLIKHKEKAIEYFGELGTKNRIYQEHHARDCQETKESRRICCKQADRVRQLRFDELSMQKEESPSTVNQLFSQVREL